MKTRSLYTVFAVFVSLVLIIGCSDDPMQPSQSQDQNRPVIQALSPLGETGFSFSTAGDFTPAASMNGLIEQVSPTVLTCDGVITFDDVAGGAAPGTNYDAVFESDGADFAERFAGMTRSGATFDALSGTPTGPLTVLAGDPNDNLSVYTYSGTSSHILTGLGPLGYPDFNAIGEGSFAVLFDYDQSEFGFDLVGGNGGSATVKFFKRDGSLIDSIVLSGLSDQAYAFRRVGGINDVAGVSVENTDPAGIGVDNICHDVPATTVFLYMDIKPGSCPNPLNPVSKGVTPVAILGSEFNDVTDIDVTTLLLEGVAPIRYNYENVSTPVVDGEECECNTAGPDGFMDLTLKFKTQDLVAVLGTLARDDVLTLTLTGTLLDGTPFELTDCMVVRGKPTVELADW